MRSPTRRRPVLAALGTALLAGTPAAAAITGVCPDGSIFVVQSADAIPCPRAKRVDPTDLPPIQPKLLPRPFGWERFNRRADPNNPYNLVDAPTGGASTAPAPPTPPTPPTGSDSSPSGASRVAAFAPAAPRNLELALSGREIAELDEIVILLQEIAPASLARYAEDGRRRAVLQLAHSAAFEQRVREVLVREGGGAGGPVLLFRTEARDDAAFHGNLTFVQGHVAFHPDPDDPAQLGLIDGAFGPLAPGQRVLGYAVLPAHLDPAGPLDVYWDDRRITATLIPE